MSPIPYMGSKRKSANHIYNVINNFTKDREQKLLVDLFSGGFAIGEEFIKKGWKVIVNDKNKYVMSLLEQSLKGLPKSVKERVSREKFKDVLNNPQKYEDWYVGYVQVCWSFGNNQNTYLYGKDIEQRKKELDNLVVNGIVSENLKKEIPKQYLDGILKQKTIYQRRIATIRVAKVLYKENTGLQRLQYMERLERLERLESLERKENILSINSLDYRDLDIPKGAIVYCDPPYKGTAEYSEDGFNHNDFRDYIRKLSKEHKVFISEYNAPDDFRAIYSFPQKSTLHGGQKHNNQPNEKIFIQIQ